MIEMKMPSDMHVSEDAMKKVFAFEGAVGKQPDGTWRAYICPAGKPTLYFGLTKGVYPGMVKTEAECKEMMARECAVYEAAIAHCVKVPLSQCGFDALFDFTFNCGEGALANVVRHSGLNKGRYYAIPGQMMRYTHYHDKDTGRLVDSVGLRRRRSIECSMWNRVPMTVSPSTEPMPQTPVARPAETIKETVVRSWTVKGLLTALTGVLANVWHEATGIASAAKSEVDALQTGLDPMNALWSMMKSNAGMLSIGVVAIGIAIALYRKFNDAREARTA